MRFQVISGFGQITVLQWSQPTSRSFQEHNNCHGANHLYLLCSFDVSVCSPMKQMFHTVYCSVYEDVMILHFSLGLKLANFTHYSDVIMGTIASQITSLTIVYSTVYSDADQRKHQSSTSLAFVWGIHWGAVNSPHKWPVTRKMFQFDEVIMFSTVEQMMVMV